MSLQLINLSPDLKKLQNEGYTVEIVSNYLVVRNIPYVNSKKEIHQGTLVSELTLAGNKTAAPKTHLVYFIGDHPCDKDGSENKRIEHSRNKNTLDNNLVIDRSFSSKPKGGYKDYYEKMTTYATIISSPAQAIDPCYTPKSFLIIKSDKEDSVFNYADTASSRAEINTITRKLELEKVTIIGLGGTGSYVMDLIVKTPIKEIHLYDGDKFLQHNAFRAPGAPSVEKLREQPKKVDYFKDSYSEMHRNIIAHDYYIDASNVKELQEIDFVFLCLDWGESKKLIVKKLEELKIPFIDVGMGIYQVGDSLAGVLRVTSSTDYKSNYITNKGRIPFSNGNEENIYSRNIQIADLNSLNASLAVVKWKKHFGFYKDFENEHFSTYTIDGNALTNEDQL